MKTIDNELEQLITLAEDAIYDGNFDEARKMIDSGLLEEPGYANLHHTLAWMYNFHKEDATLAERHYKLTLLFDPSITEAWYQLAWFYFNKKRYETLQNLLKKAEKIEDLDKDFIFNMKGKLAELDKNYNEAIRNYRMALLNSVDNDDAKDYKDNIKRSRLKNIIKIVKKWQPQK